MSTAWAAPASPSSGGGSSSADTIEGLTAQIADVKAQLASLDVRLTAATEAYDAGRIRLGRAQTAADEAAARVARADKGVQEAVAKRRGLAASAYHATGLDTLSAILSGDPGGALDRVGALDALARRAGDAETGVRLARGDLTEAQADARDQLAAAKRDFDDVAAQKKTIETSASQQQSLLDGLVSKQAELERQARERAAAAERARQQAAAAEAARIAAQAAADGKDARAQSSLLKTATDAFASQKPSSAGPALGSGGAPVAVSEARKQLGKPYVWGAAGPNTFDCSGLTQWAWAKAGVSLPHYTGDQWNSGRHVSRDELRPGDLVFFHPDLDHVGIYIGNGQMIHAPHTGAVVRIENVWWDQYRGAVRPGG